MARSGTSPSVASGCASQPCARRADAQGSEAALVDGVLRLAPCERFGLREPPVGEIPEPLSAESSRHHHLPAEVERGEHEGDAARAVPAVPLRLTRCAILELPGRERAAPLELAQHVAAERLVLGDELAHPPLGLVVGRGPPAPHQPTDDRQLLDRPDESVPLEERPLVPEKAVELCDVVAAEPAPQHEVLRRRDGRDRVELEEPQVANRVEHGRRRPVEELRADGDPARLRLVDQPCAGPGGHKPPSPDPLRHAAPSSTHAGRVSRRQRRLRRAMLPGHATRLRPRNLPRRGGSLRPDAVYTQDAGTTIEGGVHPADQRVAVQDREDVVAVLPFGGRDVHLEPIAKAEQLQRPLAVVHEPVERRQENSARNARAAVENLAMRPPLPVQARNPDGHGDTVSRRALETPRRRPAERRRTSARSRNGARRLDGAGRPREPRGRPCVRASAARPAAVAARRDPTRARSPRGRRS